MQACPVRGTVRQRGMFTYFSFAEFATENVDGKENDESGENDACRENDSLEETVPANRSQKPRIFTSKARVHHSLSNFRFCQLLPVFGENIAKTFRDTMV